MADTTTRDFGSGGPYGHVPGAAPPFHARQNDPAAQAASVSRFDGTDVDPLANAGMGGPPGITSWQGGSVGYAGRDITEPASWNGRPYNESPGMIARFNTGGG